MGSRTRRGGALPSTALVALARYRLRRTAGARLGTVGTAGVLVVTAASGVVLAHADGAERDLVGLLANAMRWLLWVGVGPLALAIAAARGERDRAEGVEALAAMRGHGASRLERARLLAAMVQTALRVAAPAVVLCLVFAFVQGKNAAAWLAQGAGLCGFSVVVGALVGGTAALCSLLAGRRGRSWLLAVVLVPWVISGATWPAEWSLPGLLDAVLSGTIQLAEKVGGGA